jgi:hypothetical protein
MEGNKDEERETKKTKMNNGTIAMTTLWRKKLPKDKEFHYDAFFFLSALPKGK